MTNPQVLIEVPPITSQDMFVIFERRKEHFDFPVHIHNEFELNFITGAAGCVRVVGDSIEEIGGKDMVLITGSKLEHAWIDGDRKTDGDIHEVTIQFSESLFKVGDTGVIDRKQFASIRKMFKDAQYGMAFSEPTIDAAEEVISRMINNRDSFKSVLDFLLLLDILSKDEHSRVLSNSQFCKVENSFDSSRVKALMEYLQANYQHKIMLSDAAAYVNMSEPSFTRFVRKHMNMSLVECLNNIRLSSATRMLVDEPSTTIAEIAYRCGFNNISNFNRIFRKSKNCTPHEFREYYRKNKIII